jgi:polygalacturonase
MSTSPLVSLLAVAVTLGYSFYLDRAARGLSDQVAELRTQVKLLHENNHLTTIERGFHEHEKKRLLQDDSPCPCDIPDGFTYARDFGVIGDAHADDTLALQAAIESASSNNSGGIVIIPKGTFRM